MPFPDAKGPKNIVVASDHRQLVVINSDPTVSIGPETRGFLVMLPDQIGQRARRDLNVRLFRSDESLVTRNQYRSNDRDTEIDENQRLETEVLLVSVERGELISQQTLVLGNRHQSDITVVEPAAGVFCVLALLLE